MVMVPVAKAAPPQLGPQALVALVTGFLTVTLGSVMFLLPTPYAVFGPGPVTDVLGEVDGKPLISVTGRRSYPHTGQGTLDMTTIEVLGGPGSKVSLFEALGSWISRDRAVVPEEQVFTPGQTAKRIRDENAQEMSSSQENATAAGLREVGLTVSESVSIMSVEPGVPAAGVLQKGDVILTIGGKKASTTETVRAEIKRRSVGDQVPITVRRSDKAVDLLVKTTQRDQRTVLGVNLRSGYDFPVTVSFASQDVGGPSAGMMFALGIFDLLTPGELTGGQKIAGTGTIDGAGRVGPIGGIAQKMVGAKAAGAQWFLAPAENCSEVRGHVPDGLRVTKADTLHQSRLAVQAIAAGRGDTLPTCS